LRNAPAALWSPPMAAPLSFSEPTTTRERLIAAAFRVVAREGLEAASVKAIAADAGLTPGLLHYHFPTKAALLEAVLRASLENYLRLLRETREANGAADQISAYFRMARESLEAERDFFKVRLAFAAQALTNPELAAVLRDMNAEATAETALTLAASRGETEPTARDRQIAMMLKAISDGAMLTWLNDPGFPIRAAAEDLELAVRGWLA
jgi:AcrR family transcriptional regulator